MYHVLSKSALALALTLSTTHWPYRHKTAEQLKQLSPSELVKELFEEEKNHPKASHLLDRQPFDITDAIKATRLKSLPYVIERISQFHPSLSGIKSEREYREFEVLMFLLSTLDVRVARLRADTDGKKAVDEVKRIFDEMHAVGWLAPGSPYEYSSYYHLTRIYLDELRGKNGADERIFNTFEKVLSIHLSEAEASGFLQYLLLKDPYYPSWEKPTCFWEPRKPPNQELKNCVNVYENENRFLVELESFRAKQLR